MPIKLDIVKNSTADCATAILTLPEIPAVRLMLNLANMDIEGRKSCCCFVEAEVNGEVVEHLVQQRRQVEDCRMVLSQIAVAPNALFINVVLKPVVDVLRDQLGTEIALPVAVKDPLSGMKALANSASIGLVTYKQLRSDFGHMKSVGASDS